MVALSLLCFVLALCQSNAFVVKSSIATTKSTKLWSTLDTTEILTSIREGMEEAGHADEWEQSVKVLASSIDSNELEDVEMLLASAWNWKAWAMATPMIRKYQKTVTPDASQLQASLQWLQDGPLGLSAEQVSTALQEHPKIYIPDPQGNYEKALETAPDMYKDPESFHALVQEDLSALGRTFNCADTGCTSDCGNCWVTYENSR